MLAATGSALCDSTSVSLTATSDRQEADVSVPQSAKVELRRLASPALHVGEIAKRLDR
jgi:hypothetical protein